MRHVRLFLAVAAMAIAAAQAADEPKVHPAITAAVASPERPEADRKRDEGRKPGIVLEFFGVRKREQRELVAAYRTSMSDVVTE